MTATKGLLCYFEMVQKAKPWTKNLEFYFDVKQKVQQLVCVKEPFEQA